jgi:hypothetical protein
MELVAQSENGMLSMYKDGDDWVIEIDGEEVERGSGPGFLDYLNRRYGSAMENVGG